MKSNFSSLGFIITMSFSLSLIACDNANQKTIETIANTEVASQAISNKLHSSETINNNLPTYDVATISTFIPFIFRDEQGHTIGFDVDILKAIGKKEGFNVNYLVVPWESIFKTVDKGSHDIISSAVVITPEDKSWLIFQNPICILDVWQLLKKT